MECCICRQEIPPVGDWTQGNDAWPVADGRCCNQCDMAVVVPARLREMRRRKMDAVTAAIVSGDGDPGLTMKENG